MKRIIGVVAYGLTGLITLIVVLFMLLYAVSALVFGSSLVDQGVLTQISSDAVWINGVKYDVEEPLDVRGHGFAVAPPTIGVYYYLYGYRRVGDRSAFRWEHPSHAEYRLSTKGLL